VTRRRAAFALAWLAWVTAFVVIEGAAVIGCGGDLGPGGCTFSALLWRVEAAGPGAWALVAGALVILGVHLASKGRA